MIMTVDKIITTTETVKFDVTEAILLSIEEAETLLTEEERKYYNWWWLRSPGYDQYLAAGVYVGGSVSYSGDRVDYALGCVRPALKIKNHSFNIGDKFIFGNKKFKVISDELAFCLEDIGEHCFREDWEAEDANEYEKSDIKKYVDNWFKEAFNGSN